MENGYTIYVLQGVDKSLVGLTIDGWTIKAAHKSPIGGDDYLVSGIPLFPKFDKLLSVQNIMQSTLYLHNGSNPFYIYLEKETTNIYSVKKAITFLRLYKDSTVGLSLPLLLNEAGGCIINGLPNYSLAYNTSTLPLLLSEQEKEDIANLSNTHKEGTKDYINKMLDVFHESFLTENKYLSFVLRIMILEMLIEGNAELSFRIARSVAVFLGKTEDESIQIHDICKKMYTARSKYLHDGITKDITEEKQRYALEISRRVIANLYFINDDINRIREVIYRGGFGSNPYQVKF